MTKKPALSYAEGLKQVQSASPMFETDKAVIRGVEYSIFKNAPGSLRDAFALAEMYGERDFLVFGKERWSYTRGFAEVKRLAGALSSHFGVKKGDRVAICMANNPEYLFSMMAIISLGAVAVPMNSWWTTEELRYGLEDSEANILFVDEKRHALAAPLIKKLGLKTVNIRFDQGTENGIAYLDLLYKSQETNFSDNLIDPDDDFVIMYTSGSTGKPKGVVLTHRGAITTVMAWIMLTMIHEVRQMEDVMGEGEKPADDAIAGLLTLPLFHVTATHSFYLSIVGGAKVVMMPKWCAQEAVRLINEEKITAFTGVPTMSAEVAAKAAEMGVEMPSLRRLESGGAKRPEEQVRQIKDVVPKGNPGSGYGMTETNAAGTHNSGYEYLEKPHSPGRALPLVVDIKIVNDADKAMPSGEVGEVIIKSAANMREYLNKPNDTKAALKNGWVYTGDLGYLDEDGFLVIVDRKKEMIIRGGENISCLEVEAALYELDGVREACVFSIPDPRLNETVGAALFLHEGSSYSLETIKEFAKQKLAYFKIPEKIWIFDEPLPRGSTEKINKLLVKELIKNKKPLT